MIDWFASKFGFLLFTIACLSCVLVFSNMQTGLLASSMDTQEASNLQKVIDGICRGCRTVYDFDEPRDVSVSRDVLTLDGVERKLLPGVSGSFDKKDATQVAISKDDSGVVKLA